MYSTSKKEIFLFCFYTFLHFLSLQYCKVEPLQAFKLCKINNVERKNLSLIELN